MDIFVQAAVYAGSSPIWKETAPIAPRAELPKAKCSVETALSGGGRWIKYRSRFAFGEGGRYVAGVVLCFDNWTQDNYLFVPAAVYNGNRFRAKKCGYPPEFGAFDSCAEGMPVTITDVPRLQGGSSTLQLTTGDMATPCIGFFDRRNKQGVLIYTRQATRLGNSSISFYEELERGSAQIVIAAPQLRERTKYAFGGDLKKTSGRAPEQILDDICDGWEFGADKAVSGDRPHAFVPGESVTIAFAVHSFPAESIHDFYKYFFITRKDFEAHRSDFVKIPYCRAFELIEQKYNRESFQEEYGYYRVGAAKKGVYQDFQSGWVGGGINSYPLLSAGAPVSKARSVKTLWFIIRVMQNAAGWFRPVFSKGEFYPDHYTDCGKMALHIRRQCDMIYYLCRQYALLEDGIPLKAALKGCILRAADALLGVFGRYGQLGQLIDCETGKLLVGGSAAGALAPAALVLAYRLFRERRFLNAAQLAGDYYYRNHLNKGIVNGGPCDVLQCMDSESIFALLESYIELYAQTRQARYLDYAEKAAWQGSSWCVSYDYVFPAGSCFNVLGIHTCGSVFANIQNKHAAPGLCALSGRGLLRLFEFTGDTRCLELLRDIAHGITQYVSCAENPLWDYNKSFLPFGYVNERVNMSDWESRACVGGVFNGSTWAETACLLTCAELPGIYVNSEKKGFAALDHLQCSCKHKTLSIFNPFDYDVTTAVRLDGVCKRVLIRALSGKTIKMTSQ